MERRTFSISLLPLLAIGVVAISLGTPGNVRHLALKSSVPVADAVVESPAEILLTFTEEPQEGTTAIRLIDAGGELVATGETTQSAEDPTVFSSVVEGVLASGAYTVSWRAMADDGHVVAEEFAFTVGTAE